jgi:5-formyltetrahydrofolate cyclo-ligase
MDKKELRRIYKEKRNSIPRSTRIVKSLEIADKLFQSEEYRSCGTLLIYASANSEVDTTAIITRALDEGKRVAVPKMTDKAHEMVFIEITSLYELTESRYGISEPPYNEEKIVQGDGNTLVALPLLAFDNNGGRLGYGGGYYDKWLSENKYASAVALAFKEQFCDCIPIEENDQKINSVITD